MNDFSELHQLYIMGGAATVLVIVVVLFTAYAAWETYCVNRWGGKK